MTLDQLINKFEAGKVTDADFEHPLARDIVEELAQCKESDVQKALFDDTRILADHIIEPYLSLDREDKLNMAEAYQTEECFQIIGGIHSHTQSNLKRSLGDSNLWLLSFISNYSRLIPILQNYIRYIEGNETLSRRFSSLAHYLCNRNIEGRRVKKSSKESMQSFYEYDFRNNSIFKKIDAKSVLESMTYGIPEELKQRVLDVASLLPQRIKALENYVKYVEENENLKKTNSSLSYSIIKRKFCLSVFACRI